MAKVETTIRTALIREYKRGYAAGKLSMTLETKQKFFVAGLRDGVRQAANFAGSFDKQITQTEYKFEDIILVKFNLLNRHKMRRKSQ